MIQMCLRGDISNNKYSLANRFVAVMVVRNFKTISRINPTRFCDGVHLFVHLMVNSCFS